ncbi:MAG TPA: hypothetical protein DCQ43_03985, partial [Treponema sp.]|nr:hypothetical protein [Treponema sp.]
MKRLFVALSLVFALAGFASAAEIDGYATVAAKGYLPAGIFAKAAGYLPGDTVSITNPATGITVDALNIGTLDKNDDIVLLVSAEAAEIMGLAMYATVPVKLSVRTGSIDGVVSGKAILSGKIDVAQTVKDMEAANAPIEESEPEVVETAPVESTAAEVSEAQESGEEEEESSESPETEATVEEPTEE